ncbi:MAG: type III pantothenate kinase [Gemmobacter sp.]|nr:type III pantothenate kinase [Gemmobacter sp.]
MTRVVDIGNTDTVFGFFEGENLVSNLRIPSKTEESTVFFEYKPKNFLLEQNINTRRVFRKILLSSVVPDLTQVLKAAIINTFGAEPALMHPFIYGKVQSYAIDDPSEIGSGSCG